MWIHCVCFRERSPLPWCRRLVSAVQQRYGSSSSRWEGVLGRHQWHCGAGDPGGPAAGPPAALPSQAEGQTEHTHGVLLHQPHCQLWIRRPRYDRMSVTQLNSKSRHLPVLSDSDLFHWSLRMKLKITVQYNIVQIGEPAHARDVLVLACTTAAAFCCRRWRSLSQVMWRYGSLSSIRRTLRLNQSWISVLLFTHSELSCYTVCRISIMKWKGLTWIVDFQVMQEAVNDLS